MPNLRSIAALITSLLLVGCASGPSKQQQVNIATENKRACKSVIQRDEELRTADEFLGNNSPTPSMMVDGRYPSPKDKETMSLWMDIQVTCNRAMTEEMSSIEGITRTSGWSQRLALQSVLEDLYVELLSGDMSYGQYFVARRNLADKAQRLDAEQKRSSAEAQRQQQAAQAQAWSNAFQNAQKSFQNQPSIGSAFDDKDDSVDCVSWAVGNSITTRCD